MGQSPDYWWRGSLQTIGDRVLSRLLVACDSPDYRWPGTLQTIGDRALSRLYEPPPVWKWVVCASMWLGTWFVLWVLYVSCLIHVRVKLFIFKVLCPSIWTSGLASHTSLSDSPVNHPSFFLLSGETDGNEWFILDWCFWMFLFTYISFFYRLLVLRFYRYFWVLCYYWIYGVGVDFWKVIKWRF